MDISLSLFLSLSLSFSLFLSLSLSFSWSPFPQAFWLGFNLKVASFSFLSLVPSFQALHSALKESSGDAIGDPDPDPGPDLLVMDIGLDQSGFLSRILLIRKEDFWGYLKIIPASRLMVKILEDALEMYFMLLRKEINPGGFLSGCFEPIDVTTATQSPAPNESERMFQKSWLGYEMQMRLHLSRPVGHKLPVFSSEMPFNNSWQLIASSCCIELLHRVVASQQNKQKIEGKERKNVSSVERNREMKWIHQHLPAGIGINLKQFATTLAMGTEWKGFNRFDGFEWINGKDQVEEISSFDSIHLAVEQIFADWLMLDVETLWKMKWISQMMASTCINDKSIGDNRLDLAIRLNKRRAAFFAECPIFDPGLGHLINWYLPRPFIWNNQPVVRPISHETNRSCPARNLQWSSTIVYQDRVHRDRIIETILDTRSLSRRPASAITPPIKPRRVGLYPLRIPLRWLESEALHLLRPSLFLSCHLSFFPPFFPSFSPSLWQYPSIYPTQVSLAEWLLNESWKFPLRRSHQRRPRGNLGQSLARSDCLHGGYFTRFALDCVRGNRQQFSKNIASHCSGFDFSSSSSSSSSSNYQNIF